MASPLSSGWYPDLPELEPETPPSTPVPAEDDGPSGPSGPLAFMRTMMLNGASNEYVIACLYRADPNRWCVEFATAGFCCLSDSLDHLVARITAIDQPNRTAAEVEAVVLRALVHRRSRNPGFKSLHRRYVEFGQQVFYPPGVPCDDCNGQGWCSRCRDLRFVAVCHDCATFKATWALKPCGCRCLCGRCALKRKLASWSKCPCCGAHNKGSVKRV